MINLAYRTLQTIINKEQSGYVSPDEFNTLANLIQLDIFRGYFNDENLDKNKENRGMVNRGNSNLPFNQRQLIDPFYKEEELVVSSPEGKKYATSPLPSDVYFIQDRGIMAGDGRVVEEVGKESFGYASKSIAAFSSIYPVYSQYGNELRMYPVSLAKPVTISYIREPKAPKWTYRIIGEDPMYDPTKGDFQDFELHASEFSNIVVRMLTYFGLNLRETEVMQIAETLKQTVTQKDNS